MRLADLFGKICCDPQILGGMQNGQDPAAVACLWQVIAADQCE